MNEAAVVYIIIGMVLCAVTARRHVQITGLYRYLWALPMLVAVWPLVWGRAIYLILKEGTD